MVGLFLFILHYGGKVLAALAAALMLAMVGVALWGNWLGLFALLFIGLFCIWLADVIYDCLPDDESDCTD